MPIVIEISCVIAGKHVLQRDLDYMPADYHAITSAVSGHIMVTGDDTEDGIHIYTAQGDHVRTLHLGLQGNKDIHGIQCSNDGLLHVVVGGWSTVTDLCTYRVSLDITRFISPFILIA